LPGRKKWAVSPHPNPSPIAMGEGGRAVRV
jgi:hypothetical protein